MNRLAVFLLSLVFITGAIWDSIAVKKVRAGVRFFASGDFTQAQEAFAEAESAEPGNETIAFDRACTLMAQGESSEAREMLQQTSLARDTQLSSAAHYNLGNMAAATARETLGPNPVNVDPSKREEVISKLLSAAGHYRDCLRVSPAHADARHNLELIRLFVKQIQAQWEERDREKAREELGLLEFLNMIESKQRAVRAISSSLTVQKSTPHERQLRRETADAQRQLQEEIGPLKVKITAELQQATSQSPPNQPDQKEQILTVMNQLADTAGELMLQAADQIQTADTNTTRQTQREVLNQLNEIYMVVAPFANVLQRAIPVQDGLMKQCEAGSSAALEDTEDESASTATTQGQRVVDFEELAWEQSRITNWTRLLSLKAEAERPQLEAQLESIKSQATDDTAAANSSPQPPTDEDSPDPAKQLAALVESMDKAIELAPLAEEHSASAESRIRAEETAEGVVEQQEALRLLKEIAEPLKDEENQDSEDQNEDQKQDGQQESGEQKDDGSEKDEQQNQQSEEQQSPSREQAESVLRRAREREREHRDLEKQLRKILGGVVPVDKDW